MSKVDWDDAFSNAAYIADGSTYPDRWRRNATVFIKTQKYVELDTPYGEHPRQKYDRFLPSTKPKGLVVFIHGGYWLDFDKSYWSHLAQGCCEQGWTVAIPSYVLAPAVKISEITKMIAQAIETCSKQLDGPIVLAGHSAGGHLVTRMICESSPLEDNVKSRITRIVSISGVHDLRNLIHTRMNEQLRLSIDEAVAESPALQTPIASANVTCWVGSKERPEFLSQANQLRDAWQNRVSNIQVIIEPNRHHFDVIASMSDPNSPLTIALVGDS
ncbi:MAG: alpha/beta hydrolase [Gammaproteobacteria bacterium]|nr:alpha/beta hydrolase [Gammaproteobacteria bacterium]